MHKSCESIINTKQYQSYGKIKKYIPLKNGGNIEGK